MRTVHAHGFTQLHRERGSPACLASGTFAGVFSMFVSISPSIFLEPFAPTELPGFIATMVPLTSVRVSRSDRSLCFMCSSFLTVPSPTTPSSPAIAFTRYPSASRASVTSLGFAFARQARQTTWPNRVHLRYGPVVRLLELPTPPRGDAVPVGHRPESVYLNRTNTFLIEHTYKRTEPTVSAVRVCHRVIESCLSLTHKWSRGKPHS